MPRYSFDFIKRILLLAVPLIISNITVPLVGLVNTALIGHLDQQVYLVALSVGVGVFNFIFQIFFFLRMSAVGLVAQLSAQEQFQKIYNIFLQYLIFSILIGIILIILMPLISMVSQSIYALSAHALTHFDHYLYIRMFSAPAAISMFLFLGFFVGVQKVRHALYVSLLINILTGLLGVFFVFYFNLAITGIAIADVIAQYIGMAYALFFIFLYFKRQEVTFKSFSLVNQLSYLFSLNTDILIRTIALVGALFLFSVFSSYMGPVVLVVNTIIMQIQSLTALALDGFANATETLSGQYAKKRDRLSQVLTSTAIASLIMAILLTIAYILTFPYILGFLTSDQQVIAKAYDYQIFVYALPIISVWCFWLDGVFTGLLRTRDMRNTMVLSVGIYLITAYLATYFNNYILFSSLLLLFILRALTLAHKLFKH